MNMTRNNNLEVILAACAELTACGRDVTTVAVKFHIPKTIPFPDTVRGVIAWQKMPDEDKKKMTEKYCPGNSTAEETEALSGHYERNSGESSMISDDAFLKMTPDDRLLYLKRLLEIILTKSSTPN